jgi:RNA polymerase sigma-70 factor (ECF subfamily)
MWDVRSGDVGRLELLFDRHHRALFHYFLHLTRNRAVAEDLTQEVFLRILKYRSTYQPETSFRAWMFQIGRNVHLDYVGRHRGEVPMAGEELDFHSQEAGAEREVQKKQEAALLYRALEAMPREKREVLIMSRFLELKYDEMAKVLRCETGAVKVRVYRALRELSDRFLTLSKERVS